MAKSFFLIIILFFMYSVVHSWLASYQAKRLSGHLVGQASNRLYRLFYNMFAVMSFIPVLMAALLLPDRLIYIVPMPWVLVSIGLQGFAAALLVVGLWQTGLGSFLGIEQLTHPTPAQPPRLALGGLYRWVRHPLYSAGLIFIWCIPRMSVNILALNLGITLYLLIGPIFEERRLIQEFGAEYEAYRQETGMLIPRFPRKIL